MSDINLAIDLDTDVAEDVDIIQLVGLKLGDEEYAIDVLKIQEIIRTVEITIVPRSDSYVLGVMNLRGKVIPVIDLRVRFNLDKMDFDKSTRIINVHFEKENIGFVVDEVTQVIRISRSMVEPTPPLVGAIGQEYILGICKYNERLILLLDIDRVVKQDKDSTDSNLRKRILDKKDKTARTAPVQQTIAKAEKPNGGAIATARAAVAPASEAQKKYSMADEVDAVSKPMIKPVSDNDSPDINEILEDAVAQGRATNVANSNALVKQHELDDLIAVELAKREAETDELNKKRKTAQQNAENALSIDDLIAAELAMREAETEELNKKKRLENSNDTEKKK